MVVGLGVMITLALLVIISGPDQTCSVGDPKPTPSPYWDPLALPTPSHVQTCLCESPPVPARNRAVAI